MLYLPDQNWSVASKAALQAAGSGTASERQAALAAEGARIPIVYGRDRRGALVANIVPTGAYVYVVCVWALGEIEAVESVTMSDKPLPASCGVTHYLGTPGQTVNAGLASAFAANGISYADALPGIAYSVIMAPVGLDGFDPLSIAAVIKGTKVYDPRTGLTAWSDNPALALAHFVSAIEGRTVAWSSVTATANACEETVGGQPRRRIGLSLAQPQVCATWREALRTYAGCFLVQRDDGIHLIPDRPASPVQTFAHTNGDIAKIGPLRKRARADAPTVVKIKWTDTSATPWRDRTATAYAPGVIAGTVERRESEVSLPGIQSASQAQREAIERLNKLWLADLSFSLDVFDDGMQIEPGDVVSVSHPLGLVEKGMRVGGIDNTGPGRWALQLVEYDPAVYSDAVVTNPSTPDTALPSPSEPPPVPSLAVSEELTQLQDGTWTSRIRATWSAPAYPWVSGYRIDVRSGGVVVYTGTASRTATSWPSPPVQERVHHQIDVFVLSAVGAESVSASATITPDGKYLLPGNVPSLTGYEVGGEVRLRWEPATDIDIWRYEIRWGAVGVAWDDAARLDRVDALSLVSRDVPAGTWNFLVCALDSVGQYSPAPARRTITVTLDNAAFLVDQHAFSTPSVTGMVEYNFGPTDTQRRWVTDDGTPWNTKFPAALNTYTDHLASYSAGSAWQTEPHDFGLSLSGNWAGEMSVTAITGTHTDYLDLSPDGSAWTPNAGLSAKTGARFARLRSTTAGAMAVTLPTASVRIDAVPRTEEGTGTSSASGAVTITLSGSYAAAKGLPQISIGGTTFATAVVDNIIVGTTTSFDVYVFDASENLISRPFGWTFKGV